MKKDRFNILEYQLKPIVTEQDYDEIMLIIDNLFEEELSQEEENIFSALLDLVHAYEEKYYPIPSLTFEESIKYFIDDELLTDQDLKKIFGSKEKALEVIEKKRPLTLTMIKKLSKQRYIYISPDEIIKFVTS